MRFAILEAKLALVELLQRFSFVRTPDTQARRGGGGTCKRGKKVEFTHFPPAHCRYR
jgi:cytochrome P450